MSELELLAQKGIEARHNFEDELAWNYLGRFLNLVKNNPRLIATNGAGERYFEIISSAFHQIYFLDNLYDYNDKYLVSELYYFYKTKSLGFDNEERIDTSEIKEYPFRMRLYFYQKAKEYFVDIFDNLLGEVSTLSKYKLIGSQLYDLKLFNDALLLKKYQHEFESDIENISKKINGREYNGIENKNDVINFNIKLNSFLNNYLEDKFEG